MKDIAPTFLEALTCLPVEALIEMEKNYLLKKHNQY